LADGNSRQLCLHLNSEPAVQEMPCFTGYVGSRSRVLEVRDASGIRPVGAFLGLVVPLKRMMHGVK
jgi:hypothetical protein